MDPMVSIVKVNTDTFTLLSVEFVARWNKFKGFFRRTRLKTMKQDAQVL